jgi:signal transduction histidine kinase
MKQCQVQTDRFGLALAVADLVEGVAETARVEVRVTELEADEAGLSAEAKTTLFRFLQEGLTNAVRHSGSRRVEIGLKPQGRLMTATVRDFGRGFEVDQALAQAVGLGRLGLLGMMDRLALLGGRLLIHSGPGGTTLQAEIPLEAGG